MVDAYHTFCEWGWGGDIVNWSIPCNERKKKAVGVLVSTNGESKLIYTFDHMLVCNL